MTEAPTPRSQAGEPIGATIAIVELVGGEALARRAAELAELVQRHPIRGLIICRGDGAGFAAVAGPNVTILPAGGETVPRRRLTALQQSRDEVLCIVEDTLQISGEWVETVMAAFRDKSVSAAWGPIAVSPRLSARSRALGVLEYGRYLAPSPDAQLPGCGMAFRRAALDAAMSRSDEGIVEHVVAARIVAAGGAIRCRSAMTAVYEVEDAYGGRLATRFGHGRLYAGTAAGGKSVTGRIALALRCLLVPAVLTLRAVGATARARNLKLSPPFLFWTMAMSCAWGAGEVWGYLAGPGDSARSWR